MRTEHVQYDDELHCMIPSGIITPCSKLDCNVYVVILRTLYAMLSVRIDRCQGTDLRDRSDLVGNLKKGFEISPRVKIA